MGIIYGTINEDAAAVAWAEVTTQNGKDVSQYLAAARTAEAQVVSAYKFVSTDAVPRAPQKSQGWIQWFSLQVVNMNDDMPVAVSVVHTASEYKMVTAFGSG